MLIFSARGVAMVEEAVRNRSQREGRTGTVVFLKRPIALRRLSGWAGDLKGNPHSGAQQIVGALTTRQVVPRL